MTQRTERRRDLGMLLEPPRVRPSPLCVETRDAILLSAGEGEGRQGIHIIHPHGMAKVRWENKESSRDAIFFNLLPVLAPVEGNPWKEEVV